MFELFIQLIGETPFTSKKIHYLDDDLIGCIEFEIIFKSLMKLVSHFRLYYYDSNLIYDPNTFLLSCLFFGLITIFYKDKVKIIV